MSFYRATLDQKPTVDDGEQRSLMVKIWDLGPLLPDPPVRPDLPQGKEGDPEYDLAMIEFAGVLADYQARLIAFGQGKRDYTEWRKLYGGPYEKEMYSVDAREAIMIDPERYVTELPQGKKPGRYHAEQKKAAVDARQTFKQLVANDPVFGNQGAAP